MRISEYTKEYTAGKRITFRDVISEINEFFAEVIKINNLNKNTIREEFEDILHFLQLWLYWRFGIDGEIWKITKNSVSKFIDT